MTPAEIRRRVQADQVYDAASHHIGSDGQLWDALTERGFDPGYQEVMASEAASRGEHWSNLDIGDGQHVHITSDDEGETYTLTDAGPACTLPHPRG